MYIPKGGKKLGGVVRALDQSEPSPDEPVASADLPDAARVRRGPSQSPQWRSIFSMTVCWRKGEADKLTEMEKEKRP